MTGGGTAVPVFMYHEVTGWPDTESPLAVAPAAFARQLAALAAGGFTTVTMSALAAALAGQAELPPRPAAITFDDGYADFHSAALPLLKAHGFTATVFVTTGWVGGIGPAVRPRPARMLSWEQILEAAAAGIEIGAHTHSHPQLDQLPVTAVASELNTSKDLLEVRLGCPVTGMAYPFGYSSARVRLAARAAGYRYACVVGNRAAQPGRDQFALPRLTVKRSTRLATFGYLSGTRYLPVIYAADRSLTKGYAVVRRTRAAMRSGWRHS